ncbi:unnamed protein product [Allacma fusca]|uniref:Uncharacterized protein n=1 Tax=Allacma fusca TaxID=39272 RepID=A0A8J2K8H1_9HEXA|nr:unnamed protein product [Allacma fusca]
MTRRKFSQVLSFFLTGFSLLCFPLRCLIRKIRECRVVTARRSGVGKEMTQCSGIQGAQKWTRSSTSMNLKKRQRLDSFCFENIKMNSDSPEKRRRLEGRHLYGRKLLNGTENQKRLHNESNECIIPSLKVNLTDLTSGAYLLCDNDCGEQLDNYDKKDLLAKWSRSKLPMNFEPAGKPYHARVGKLGGSVIPRGFQERVCSGNILGENQLQLVSRKGKVSNGLATRSPLRNLNVVNSSMVPGPNTSSPTTGVTVTPRSRIPRRTTAV